MMYLVCMGLAINSAAQSSAFGGAVRPVGAGSTLVHSKFGGQIFGFDIDQNGTEGVLTEAKDIAGGKVLAAVETFDQASGKILNVVSKIASKDDFLTLGVVGTSVGFVEREHVQNIFVSKRIYEELNPLDLNKFTGKWTPPLVADDIILGVSRNQGSPNTAILAFHNDGKTFTSFVFTSNVGANTFEPLVTLTDTVFGFDNGPQVAYDSLTNQIVVASSDGAVGGPPPKLALVDATTGTVTEFTGIPGPPPFLCNSRGCSEPARTKRRSTDCGSR